jgi:predicted anti-sigma-YlaC factor YlaD
VDTPDPCARARERAQDLCDAALRPQDDAEVRAHADACAACRAEVDIIRGIHDLLRGQVDPDPPADLVATVVAGVAREARRARARARVLAAAAAAVVLALAISVTALGWDPIAATHDLASDGAILLERASRVSQPSVDPGSLDELRRALESALGEAPAVPFALAAAAALATVHLAAALRLRTREAAP